MKKGLFVMVLVVLLAVFASEAFAGGRHGRLHGGGGHRGGSGTGTIATAVILGGIGGVILDRTVTRPGPSYPSAYPQYGYGYGIPSCQDLATDIEQERSSARRRRTSRRFRHRNNCHRGYSRRDWRRHSGSDHFATRAELPVGLPTVWLWLWNPLVPGSCYRYRARTVRGSSAAGIGSRARANRSGTSPQRRTAWRGARSQSLLNPFFISSILYLTNLESAHVDFFCGRALFSFWLKLGLG